MTDTILEATETLSYAAQIVAAFTSNNPIAANEIPALIRSVYAALTGLSSSTANEATSLKPAVRIF